MDTTLLQHLHLSYPDSSKSTLRKWITLGRVECDGIIVSNPSTSVSKDSQVVVNPKQKSLSDEVIVEYEDQDLIVINKPSGLLSVATDDDKKPNLHSLLKIKYPTKRVYPVHRLDRDTSGIIVYAFSEIARNSLKEQFKDHSIERIYFAILSGRLEKQKGMWESNLVDTKSYHVKSSTRPEAKKAITHFEVVKTTRHQTFVTFRLETGKKNQIRVHASEAGHPIVGDKKYGSLVNPYHRLALHAYKLVFFHPTKKKEMSFISKAPFG